MKPMKLIEVDKILEILSDIRARYNCFDIDEAACYHVLSDAIAAVNKSPKVIIMECEEEE